LLILDATQNAARDLLPIERRQHRADEDESADVVSHSSCLPFPSGGDCKRFREYHQANKVSNL